MKNQRRIKLAIHRYLRALAKGGASYDRAGQEIDLVVNLGLTPAQTVEIQVPNKKTGEIETRQAVLVDNRIEMTTKGRVYRPARVPCYQIELLPKTQRVAKPDPTEETAQ